MCQVVYRWWSVREEEISMLDAIPKRMAVFDHIWSVSFSVFHQHNKKLLLLLLLPPYVNSITILPFSYNIVFIFQIIFRINWVIDLIDLFEIAIEYVVKYAWMNFPSLLKMEIGSASGQDAALLGSLLSCTWEGHFVLGSLGWWVGWPSWWSIIPLLLPTFLGQIPHLTKKFKLKKGVYYTLPLQNKSVWHIKVYLL